MSELRLRGSDQPRGLQWRTPVRLYEQLVVAIDDVTAPLGLLIAEALQEAGCALVTLGRDPHRLLDVAMMLPEPVHPVSTFTENETALERALARYPQVGAVVLLGDDHAPLEHALRAANDWTASHGRLVLVTSTPTEIPTMHPRDEARLDVVHFDSEEAAEPEYRQRVVQTAVQLLMSHHLDGERCMIEPTPRRIPA